VVDAEATLPSEILGRLESAEKLNEEDRKAIIETARQALEAFLVKPDEAKVEK
jgi:hypothetical protein